MDENTCWATLEDFLSYTTYKVVKLRDKRLGLFYRFLMFTVLGYVIGYVLIYNQEYLTVQYAQGDVATKVKGTAFYGNRQSYLDEADFVQPALEYGAVFLVTRRLFTKEQFQGYCIPSSQKRVNCTNTTDCVPTANFLKAGRCNAQKKLCEYFQWCPAERDVDDTIDLYSGNYTEVQEVIGIENATIWIKGTIEFPILSPQDSFFTTMASSVPVTNPDSGVVNLFSVKQIIEMAGESARRGQILSFGAIFKLSMHWDCMVPTLGFARKESVRYTAKRLDNVQLRNGFNYREADYYVENKIVRRNLKKVFGVRVFIESRGKGQRFDFIRLILTIGSSLALLGIARVATDFLITWVLPVDNVYLRYKMELSNRICRKYESSQVDRDWFARVTADGFQDLKDGDNVDQEEEGTRDRDEESWEMEVIDPPPDTMNGVATDSLKEFEEGLLANEHKPELT